MLCKIVNCLATNNSVQKQKVVLNDAEIRSAKFQIYSSNNQARKSYLLIIDHIWERCYRQCMSRLHTIANYPSKNNLIQKQNDFFNTGYIGIPVRIV